MRKNILTYQRLFFLFKHPLSFWEGDLKRKNIKKENLIKEIYHLFSLPQSNGKVCPQQLEILLAA